MRQLGCRCEMELDFVGRLEDIPRSGAGELFMATVRVLTATTKSQLLASSQTRQSDFTIQPSTSTAFTDPGDFLPPLSAARGFALAPGASTTVKATLPAAHVPSAGTSTHLLASVYTATDEATAGSHVGGHNNLAQRDLGPVPVASVSP